MSNGNTGENEREHVSKLFPKSNTPNKLNNATSNPPPTTKTEASPTKTTSGPTATPSSLSLAQKIEVSTPKGGSFDVLGSIMKDMKK